MRHETPGRETMSDHTVKLIIVHSFQQLEDIPERIEHARKRLEESPLHLLRNQLKQDANFKAGHSEGSALRRAE